MTALTSLVATAARAHEVVGELVPLAADPSSEEPRPGWITFLVVALLITASTLLWFSMRRQLGKIRVPREGEGSAGGPGGPGGSRPADPDNDKPTDPPLS